MIQTIAEERQKSIGVDNSNLDLANVLMLEIRAKLASV
jgi:hypothetical protein